jgi:hypothetical protein
MPTGWLTDEQRLEQTADRDPAEWLAVRVLQDCNMSQLMMDDARKVLADLGWPDLAIKVASGERV